MATTVKIDLIGLYFLRWLYKGEGEYWMYTTSSKQIDNLLELKLVRFKPGKYSSMGKRIVEITDKGRLVVETVRKNELERAKTGGSFAPGARRVA